MNSQTETIATPSDTDSSAGSSPTREAGVYGPSVVFHYLSQLLNSRVRFVDESRPFGRLFDIGAATTRGYPQAIALEVKCGHGAKRVLPWSSVVSLGPRETTVDRQAGPVPQVDFWARRDVLDDQVVDVSGVRVLRVNDVHLVCSDHKAVFGHVEVGILGLLRRLRFEKPVSFLLRWLFDYTIKESFVTWRHIEVISPGGVPGGVRVSVLPHRLAGAHPAELAEVMDELGLNARQALFKSLPVETAAETLEEAGPELQRTLVAEVDPGRTADILEEMPSREAAGVLRDLGPDAQDILNSMENGAAAGVKSLLAHKGASAGGVMSTSCIEARPDETVADVLERIRRTVAGTDAFHHIYVLDAGRHLLGLLTLKELLQSDDDARMDGLMRRGLVTVSAETSLRDVTRLFVKYGFRAIPVVDAQNVFLGSVRFHGVLSELAPFVRE